MQQTPPSPSAAVPPSAVPPSAVQPPAVQPPAVPPLSGPKSALPDLASSQLAGTLAAPPARPAGVPLLPTRLRQPGRQAPLPDAVAIRRLAVPDGAPPYDDELGASCPRRPDRTNRPVPATPLARAGDTREPAVPAQCDVPSHCDEAGQPSTCQSGGPERPGAPERPSGPGQLKGPHRPRGGPGQAGTDVWPSRFAQVLAETLAGSRPAQQLTPWTTEQARRRIRELGPLLATDQRPRVRRLLTSAPASDVLELTAVVGFGPRIRALAVRLEREQGPISDRNASKWRCTAVESA